MFSSCKIFISHVIATLVDSICTSEADGSCKVVRRADASDASPDASCLIRDDVPADCSSDDTPASLSGTRKDGRTNPASGSSKGSSNFT